MRTFKMLAIATALAGFGVAAHATTVTQWSYSNLATFSSATFSSGSAGNTFSSSSVLSWGDAGANQTTPSSGPNVDRSYLTIGNGIGANGLYNGQAATGNVFTNGATAMGEIFTHWNNPISGLYPTLTGGIVTDTLTLTPIMPSGGSSVTPTALSFNFHFAETSNGTNNASCPGNNVGSTTPCGDLFGFTGTPNFNIPFVYGYPSEVAQQYYASIFVINPNNQSAIPIYWLNDGQCATLGFGSALQSSTANNHVCQGFITNEQQINSVQFGFAITSQPIDIPEPGVLALLGSALLSLGFSRKARGRKA